MHWPMALESVRALVPSQLEIDLYAGQAYVSLIPFVIVESRPRGMPRVLASRFLETNVRTYVKAASGEAGIYFFSLDASSWLAVTFARLLYGLPYFPAEMSASTEGSRIEYTARRRGARDAELEVGWILGDPREGAHDRTRDHFLIERYSLFVERGDAIYQGRVRHRPYPLRHVTITHLSETLLAAAGLPRPNGPPLSHYSPGVDVDIFWLQRERC